MHLSDWRVSHLLYLLKIWLPEALFGFALHISLTRAIIGLHAGGAEKAHEKEHLVEQRPTESIGAGKKSGK
jgi:hypothetical protein